MKYEKFKEHDVKRTCTVHFDEYSQYRSFLENDFDVMNFSKLGSYNSVFPYSTFTMPEHDVYFYPNFPM